MTHFSPIHQNSLVSSPLPYALVMLEKAHTRLSSLFDRCIKAIEDEVESNTLPSFSDQDKARIYCTVQTTLLPTIRELLSIVTALEEEGTTEFQDPFIKRCQQLMIDYLEIYNKLGGPFKHQCWLVEFDIEFLFYIKDPTQDHLAKARALLTEYEEKMLNPLRELAQTMPQYQQDFDRYKTYFDLLSHLWLYKSASTEVDALDLAREILEEHDEGTSSLALCVKSIAKEANLLERIAETKALSLSQHVRSLLILFSQGSPNLFSLLPTEPPTPPPSAAPLDPLKLREFFDYYIGRSPEHDWYRFFIDSPALTNRPEEEKLTIPAHLAFDYARGWRNSETKTAGELGYFQAMCNAFSYIRETLGQPFTSRELELLHDKCISKVQGLTSPIPGIAVDMELIYPIKWSRVTEAARRELDEQKLIYDESVSSSDPTEYIAYLDREPRRVLCRGEIKKLGDPEMPLVVREHASEQSVRDQIDRLFETYYATIQGSDNDGKLTAIVNLCRSLEILHAFRDGNQRTIAFALLTKLLLENGFPPAILERPEMFDGYSSTKEMVLTLSADIDYYMDYEAR